MSTNKQPCRLLSRRIRLYSWLFVVGNLCFPVQAEPFVINSAGSKVVGSAIRSEPDGTVLLTTLNGQTLTFRPGTYQTAFADKPKEMFQVEAMARQGDLDGAAGILRRVKEQYLFLGWDQRAGLMLARVELAREKFEDAAAEYESLFAAQPKFKAVPAERSRYMQALLGAGRIRETAELIDEATVRDVHEVMKTQNLTGAIVVASSNFSRMAIDFVESRPLELLNKDKLHDLLKKSS